MSEITLVSRELTFFDMEFQESDISSNDKKLFTIAPPIPPVAPVTKIFFPLKLIIIF